VAPFGRDEAVFQEQWSDGWAIDMNWRPALRVPATLGTTGSEDVLDGIVLGLLGQRMDPFLTGGEVVGLHSPAANAFGSGLIAEAPSDRKRQLKTAYRNDSARGILQSAC